MHEGRLCPITRANNLTDDFHLSTNRLLSFDRRLLIAFFILLIFAAAARPITDPDFWWHLRTGQYILETRSIPHTDIFSSVKLGSEWVTHEWLSEVLMYWIFQASSYAGLIAFFAFVVALSFFVTYQRCEIRAPDAFVSGLALLLGTAATIPTWGVRPQMFSILFAAVFLWVLDQYQQNRKSRIIWWLIAVTVLWVNMHAGFPVGLVLILLTIVGIALDEYILQKGSINQIWQRTRVLFLVWLLSLVAVSLNPNGLRIYSYPFETLRSRSMMQYIHEWRPPDFQDPMFLGLIVFIVVILCTLAVSRKRALPSELVILSATAAATLRSARNVPFFALVATPILASHLLTRLAAYTTGGRSMSRDSLQLGSYRRVAIGALLLVVAPLLAAALRIQNSTRIQPVVETRQFPSAAVEFMRSTNLPQPIFNEYDWGGYLIWKLYPRYRVFIDGRADVYGDQLIEEFFRIHDGTKDWRNLLDHYGIQAVIVSPDAAIASLLREDKGWRNVFEDGQTAIFTRVGTKRSQLSCFPPNLRMPRIRLSTPTPMIVQIRQFVNQPWAI